MVNKAGKKGYAWGLKDGRKIGMGAPSMANKYSSIQNRQPTDKFVAEHFTDTTVSPCNPYGADHCNYVTHTFHLNMDTKIKYMDTSFCDLSNRLGGHYQVTDDITIGQTVNNMMLPFLQFVLMGGITGLTLTACVQPINPACAVALLAEITIWGFMKALDYYKNAACNGDFDPTFLDGIVSAIVNLGVDDDIDTSQLGSVIAGRARNSEAGQVQDMLLRRLDSLNAGGKLIRI